MNEVKMNIYQKLIEVRKDVEFLKKESQGEKFKYNSSSQVLMSIRKKLDEMNLLLIPAITDKRLHQSAIEYRNDHGHVTKRTITYFTELDMTMTWVNGDNPEEQIQVPWYAQGVDIAGEKGVGKALTYAEKYFILKQFNIATDKDDPDSFQGDDKPRGTQGKSGKNTLSESKPITSQQIGEIKAIVKELAIARQKTDADYYKALQISDLTKLTQEQANTKIAQLKIWQDQLYQEQKRGA